uniref:hypothetical protein n=1 Tax=Cephaleuros karstenii TaxID=1985640 RepID=UPI001EDD5C06|nr:hypothetical protein MFR52_pgp019 [Cephaleuros karstenii]UIB39140.1 hypothetical protein [Cephaleuros karstenii]
MPFPFFRPFRVFLLNQKRLSGQKLYPIFNKNFSTIFKPSNIHNKKVRALPYSSLIEQSQEAIPKKYNFLLSTPQNIFPPSFYFSSFPKYFQRREEKRTEKQLSPIYRMIAESNQKVLITNKLTNFILKERFLGLAPWICPEAPRQGGALNLNHTSLPSFSTFFPSHDLNRPEKKMVENNIGERTVRIKNIKLIRLKQLYYFTI